MSLAEQVDALATRVATEVKGRMVAGIAGLPAGVLLSTTGTTRPTARTDLVVVWLGDDPGDAAMTGDLWIESV